MASILTIRACSWRLGRSRRAGQTIVFLVTMLVIVFFVALWNLDLRSALRVKQLAQNGGDSAATMAARWQGISLNLIGDLNLMKAVALSGGNPSTVNDIDDVQKRLCFVGPMIGVMASQQAAKNNRIYADTNYSLMVSHADRVRNRYPREYTNPPYATAWQEYADMLDLVATEGVAAKPLNPDYYRFLPPGCLLGNPEFYAAILRRNYCWFRANADALNMLETYTDYGSWIGCESTRECVNCEYYSLRLTRVESRLSDIVDLTTIASLATQRLNQQLSLGTGLTNVTAWYCYNGDWGVWSLMSPDRPYPLQLTGSLRPEADYAGADAKLCVQTESHRFTPGTSDALNTWSAAAKPFGYLGTADNKEKPNTYGLVLPAFREARLIPVDACSGGNPSISAPGDDWVEHCNFHILGDAGYLQQGPDALVATCTNYCRALGNSYWESSTWRDWMLAEVLAATCFTPGGPGGGGGGGGGGGSSPPPRRGH